MGKRNENIMELWPECAATSGPRERLYSVNFSVASSRIAAQLLPSGCTTNLCNAGIPNAIFQAAQIQPS